MPSGRPSSDGDNIESRKVKYQHAQVRVRSPRASLNSLFELSPFLITSLTSELEAEVRPISFLRAAWMD